MAKHYNPTITQDVLRIFNLKSGDPLSSEIADQIIANVPIVRQCNIIKHATGSATTTSIYGTPVDKDFYITACVLSVCKDVTATSNSTWIQATLEGLPIKLALIAGIALTPQSEVISVSFPNPIKVDRNTGILLNNATNVANIRAEATIMGYTVEMTS
jgi:hypothetical protein